MRHLTDMVRRTRLSLVRLVNGLHEDVKSLEAKISFQKQQLIELEAGEQESIQVMEHAQHGRKNAEVKRRRAMSDKALRSDLEKQYGKTNWAKKVIRGIMHDRTEVVDITWPIVEAA